MPKITLPDGHKKEIPNNTLYWLENTGHFLMLENPEEWIKLMLK